MSASSRLLFLLALAAAAPGASALDLVQNGDFTGSIDGWTTSSTGTGVAQYESFLGSPAGGSLRLQVYGIGTAHAEQCLDVSQLASVDVTLRKFKNAESGSGVHQFKLVVHDAAGCGGSVIDTIDLPETGNSYDGWIETAVFGTPLATGALSALVTLDTSSSDAGSVAYYLMDHVRAGFLDDVFKDSFEAN